MATTIFDLIDRQGGLDAGAGYIPNDDDYINTRQISNSYFLSNLAIQIKNGTWISMTEVFQDMEIFEDIYSSAVHGSISILDMSGGFSKFAITGGETIKMTICKSVEDSDVIISRDDFIVYQITDMRVAENNAIQFRMNFISKSAIEAQKKRLYRTYQNERVISNLVKMLYKEIAGEGDLYLKIDDNKCKIDRDFVSSGYTPLQSIDALAKRACASGDYYLFFERLSQIQGKKHVFTSMENMKNKVDAFNTGKIYLAHNITTTNFTALSGSAFRVYSVSFVDNYNHLQNMMAGLYNSGIKILDITSRSYTDMKISYKDETTATEQAIESNNYFNQYQNFFPEQPGERIVARGTNDITSNSGSWLKIDTVNSVIISMFRLLVDMPGNNRLGVGNYVTLVLPSYEARNLNINAGVIETDALYTGDYLITAVRHNFTNKEYTKKVEVSRIDSPINIDTVVSNGF